MDPVTTNREDTRMDDHVPTDQSGGEEGPTAEQLEAWRSEPQATASEVAAMTDGRPEADRMTVKAVRTRLDRNSLGHLKVGNLRMVPRSEAIRAGVVRESEWPVGGAVPQHAEAAPMQSAAVPAGQQPVVIDVSEVIETVAKYAAQAAEGRLLEAQAGERERQEQRERRLLEETVHELRTMNKALQQQVESAQADRDAIEARRAELAEKIAACEQARVERSAAETVDAGDQGATVTEARASSHTGGWWGKLMGRSSPA